MTTDSPPREPTQAMIEAGHEAFRSRGSGFGYRIGILRFMWSAMWDEWNRRAAPAAADQSTTDGGTEGRARSINADSVRGEAGSAPDSGSLAQLAAGVESGPSTSLTELDVANIRKAVLAHDFHTASTPTNLGSGPSQEGVVGSDATLSTDSAGAREGNERGRCAENVPVRLPDKGSAAGNGAASDDRNPAPSTPTAAPQEDLVNRPNLAKSADGLVEWLRTMVVEEGIGRPHLEAADRIEAQEARIADLLSDNRVFYDRNIALETRIAEVERERDRISELHAESQREIDEDNFEIASLLERAERAEAALAAAQKLLGQANETLKRWAPNNVELIAAIDAARGKE